MALYKRTFTAPRIAEVHLLFRDAIRAAEEAEAAWAAVGQPGAADATRRELLRAYAEFNAGLNTIARDTAKLATAETKAALKASRRRPDTGMTPHLATAIVSRPLRRFGALATGEVGVADIEVLDAVVNPVSPQYGPYWRAQEDGTLHQAGRVVYGGFYGSGGAPGPFKPDPAFRSPAKGPHPVFISTHNARGILSSAGFSGGPGKQGGAGGGKMTIGVELPARHFIRKGANAALAQWRTDIAALQANVDKRIAAAISPLVTGRRP